LQPSDRRRSKAPIIIALNLIVIAHISGTLAQKIPGEIVVDVNGVGYQIVIPLNVFYGLPELGGRVSLQVYTHVREDALQLFGFRDNAEKQIFLLLTAVSGIGPKLAINILSGIAADDLARALKDGNQVRLVGIPGVGKKLAERMIVELKDKFMTLPSEGAASKPTASDSQLMQDAVSALVNLGYRRGEAENNIRAVVKEGEASLENILKEALRRMGR
jgi:holliday junction DNA helicase RuvA